MIKKVLLTLFLLLSLVVGPQIPVKAEPSGAVQPTNYDVVPSQSTSIELKSKTTNIFWFEDYYKIQVTYSLENPTDKKLKLGLSFFHNRASLPEDFYPQIMLNKVSELNDILVETEYKAGTYTWSLNFDSGEKQLMVVTYSLPREVNNAGLVFVDYSSLASSRWAELPNDTVVNLNFAEVNPAQVREIEPLTYKFHGNQLSWTFPHGQAESVIIKADTFTEKRQWETLITQEERNQLTEFVAAKDYLSAAELFRVKSLSGNKESRLELQEVQGYFLIKAGLAKEALPIWQDLFDNKSGLPRAYWELGQGLEEGNSKKIVSLYERVRDLQVNPLLQEWLASMLQPGQRKYNPPLKPQVEISNEGVQEGVLLQISLLDPDGDLEKVIVNYHWDDQPREEKVIELQPFKYEHSTSLFVPAPGPFKKLFYEITAIDQKGQQSGTGQKEIFYLNNQLRGPVYSLQGAMLVLADYTQTEQDKVDKWFRSYLKIAQETEFVPIKEHRPYFIFVGQDHEFISQYQGPHFIHYTPAPFSPELTKIRVHRYLLSYLYGQGWNLLPETEFAQLGDALLLGRGRYKMFCQYLSAKDAEKFGSLLSHIGQNADFDQGLTEIYGMSRGEVHFRALWHAYGSMVIAVLLIILFAWLGKNGHFTRIISYFMERKNTN